MSASAAVMPFGVPAHTWKPQRHRLSAAWVGGAHALALLALLSATQGEALRQPLAAISATLLLPPQVELPAQAPKPERVKPLPVKAAAPQAQAAPNPTFVPRPDEPSTAPALLQATMATVAAVAAPSPPSPAMAAQAPQAAQRSRGGAPGKCTAQNGAPEQRRRLRQQPSTALPGSEQTAGRIWNGVAQGVCSGRWLGANSQLKNVKRL